MKELELLETYNKWRRGADIRQPNPTDIGKSIDFVLMEIERLNRLSQELTEALYLALPYVECY